MTRRELPQKYTEGTMRWVKTHKGEWMLGLILPAQWRDDRNMIRTKVENGKGPTELITHERKTAPF